MKDQTDKLSTTRPAFVSAEGLIGIGTTVAALGVFFLLLALAEQMRGVIAVARVWIVLGAVFLVLGGLTITFARIRYKRP